MFNCVQLPNHPPLHSITSNMWSPDLHTSTPYMFCTMPFNTNVPCFTKDHLQMTSTKGHTYYAMTTPAHSKCLTSCM